MGIEKLDFYIGIVMFGFASGLGQVIAKEFWDEFKRHRKNIMNTLNNKGTEVTEVPGETR